MLPETEKILSESLDAIEEAFDPDLKAYKQHMTAHRKEKHSLAKLHTPPWESGSTPHEDAQKHSKAAQLQSKAHKGFPKRKPGQSMHHPSHYGAAEAHMLAAHYAEKAAKHYGYHKHLAKAYSALANYHHGKASDHWDAGHQKTL